MSKTIATGTTLGLAIAGLFNAIMNMPAFGGLIALVWIISALRALKVASNVKH